MRRHHPPSSHADAARAVVVPLQRPRQHDRAAPCGRGRAHASLSALVRGKQEAVLKSAPPHLPPNTKYPPIVARRHRSRRRCSQKDSHGGMTATPLAVTTAPQFLSARFHLPDKEARRAAVSQLEFLRSHSDPHPLTQALASPPPQSFASRKRFG
eukprot:2338638-Pyramimonas_sp.AAC.4